MGDQDNDPFGIGNAREERDGLSSAQREQRDSWFGALFGGVALAVAVVAAIALVRKHEDMALPALLGVVIVAAIVKLLRSGWATKK